MQCAVASQMSIADVASHAQGAAGGRYSLFTMHRYVYTEGSPPLARLQTLAEERR